MNTLQIIQSEVRPWAEQNFPDATSVDPLLGLAEEVGELCHAFLKRKQRIRGTPEEHALAIQDAVGDILVYLCDFCNRERLDASAVLVHTWEAVKQRDWKKNPINGHD